MPKGIYDRADKSDSLRVSKDVNCSGCGDHLYIKSARRTSTSRHFCKVCRKDADYNRFKTASGKYGLTFEDLRVKYSIPNCECCGVVMTSGGGPGKTGKHSRQIDHCHTTGRVRGVICWNCNVGIGKLEDTEEGVQKALDYLNRRQL
tara:strand:+ start:43 stop:483 length:441 start_codon:yes stop_codon:yes gene_type:complete